VKGGSDSELNAGEVVQHRKANPYTQKLPAETADKWKWLGLSEYFDVFPETWGLA
jgi:hypothetical protein